MAPPVGLNWSKYNRDNERTSVPDDVQSAFEEHDDVESVVSKMTAVEREVDQLVGSQLMTVDGWRSTHDQFNRRTVDEDADGLRARDAAVAALDVFRFHDELAADVPRQNVRARTLRRTRSMNRFIFGSKRQTSEKGFRCGSEWKMGRCPPRPKFEV